MEREGHVTEMWLTLELDVDRFDFVRFAPYVTRCREAGIRFSTMADIGSGDAALRSLYELNRECSADIPQRGEFYTLPEYIEQRIDAPSYDPRGVVIATDGADWIGMVATSDWRSRGYVFNEMTGVRSTYRGRGVALAMKALAIPFAPLCGVTKIRTVHRPDNLPAITLNRTLGYVDADFAHRA